MVAHIVVAGPATAITPPSGWVQIRKDTAGSLLSAALYYKILSSPETGSYTFTFATKRKASGGISLYSGAASTNPVDASSGRTNAATAVITAPSMTTTTANDKYLFFAAVTTSTTITPPPGMDQRWISVNNGATTSAATDQDLGAAGATGEVVGASGSSTASNIGQLVALRPSDVAPIATSTRTATPVATGTPSPTPMLEPTLTDTPSPTATDTPIPTATRGDTPTDTPVVTPAATATPTTAETAVATDTSTPVATPTATTTPTRRPPATDIVIAAAGDVVDTCMGTSCAYYRVSDVVLGIQPNAVLGLGDLSNNSGSLSDYTGPFDDSWGRFKAVISPVPGNHEYGTAGAAGYFSYFGEAAHGPNGYYSFDLGAWHFVALNSNCAMVPGGCAAGSPQEQWLRADLAASSQPCTIAFWHHPRYSTGHDGDNTFMSPIFQVLYDAGAEIVLSGHSHNYERFIPQDNASRVDMAHGITQFVVGTGGAFWTGWKTSSPNSQVRQNTVYGALQLTLHASSYDWRFRPEAGQTWTDSGSASCH